jgi:type II secretory pathway predicted ATPase ExeA
MQLDYWGINESPFGAQGRLRFFYASPTHDEALARLGYLVDSGYTLGILAGYEGMGRTTVLEAFGQGLRRQGHLVCPINLVGLDDRAFLWTLAASLGCNPRKAEDVFALTCRVQDRITSNGLTGRTTVLLLDDADQTSHDVLVQVLRLLKMHTQRLTVILAIEPSHVTRLGGNLLQLSQLRIRLEPWNVDDIRRYLATSLARVGCESSVFDDSAILRLQELTDGIPRWVGQLAELALMAAASRGQDSIDGRVIEAVYQELSASFAEEPLDAAY